MEKRGASQHGSLSRVAVVDLGQDAGRLIPLGHQATFGHHSQLPQGERQGIDSYDSGEFVNESFNFASVESI